MQTFSLCMIVKNEEKNLERCLSSVGDLMDEMIIVDTGSTDRTKEIAHQYTDRVFDFEWIDDFAAARNFSFAKATMDYIIWLDGDDVLLPKDREGFKKLKETLDPSVDAVMMKYNVGFDQDHNVTFSFYRERLVKRECHFQWQEPVHEYLRVSGNVILSEVAVTHSKEPDHTGNSSKRNLSIYEKIRAAGTPLSPRGMYYYARELKDNGKYEAAAEAFLDFLDQGKGWQEDNIYACIELAVCYEQLQLAKEQHLALLRSFLYDTPRAEACCALGYFYKKQNDFARAIFWFKLATTLSKPKANVGFIREDCWGFIPFLELSVCYDRMGHSALAENCNELAAKWKPDDPSVAFNRQYFKSLKNK
ncbi:MAG TPA: glycosyltransferase family 2 protein [Clostridiales bacterium]|nr:glycosyltransferase family 2 protein [Clostridiales bacterium]